MIYIQQQRKLLGLVLFLCTATSAFVAPHIAGNPRRTTTALNTIVDANPYSVHREEVQQEHYDTIVIGSGVGGMATASLLANNQQKVLVLEQHNRAGGACHTFQRNGYEFGTGVHYVPNVGENGSLKRILDALTPKDDPIVWDKMAGMCFCCRHVFCII